MSQPVGDKHLLDSAYSLYASALEGFIKYETHGETLGISTLTSYLMQYYFEAYEMLMTVFLSSRLLVL